MKAICYFVGSGHKYTLPTWFKHEATIDVTMDQIMELYNTGASVLLLHHNKSENNKQMMICVDDRL